MLRSKMMSKETVTIVFLDFNKTAITGNNIYANYPCLRNVTTALRVNWEVSFPEVVLIEGVSGCFGMAFVKKVSIAKC